MDAARQMYRFGLYEFDAESLELTREGRLVPIQNQPAQLLVLLIEKAGKIVSKQEMIDHIWGEDVHVNHDEGLSYCIKQIRLALHDRADNPCFVQNVPRRGYRFIAPLAGPGTASDDDEASAPPVREAAPAWTQTPWIRNAVWFVLILMAIGLLYVIYEDWPR